MSSVSGIRLPGLATGMDTEAMVKAMVTADQEKIDSSSVKISIKAPKEKVILRKEVYERVKDENSNAIVTQQDILDILK